MASAERRTCFFLRSPAYQGITMAFPIRTCVKCGEEFELKPDKPGFANRCPECSEPGADDRASLASASGFQNDREANAERRRTMRDMLYRKDS
jgi:hypothetical protein